MSNSGLSMKTPSKCKTYTTSWLYKLNLALINRSSSTKIYYQTFSKMWVVWNINFPVLASGLTGYLIG